MLAILDYGAGNQTSVKRALEHLGVSCAITADCACLDGASGIIFPGVGAAAQAMASLQASGLDSALRRAVAKNQPILGICLGCQILLEHSDEGSTPGLGMLPGVCKAFAPGQKDEDGDSIKIPHMGWNGIHIKKESPLLHGLSGKEEFYFVHGYYVEPADDLVLATTRHGHEFCSIYGRDNLWGAQFHPEKSGRAGLRILENFNQWCARKCSPKG